MGANSKISWTHHSWNPWHGCSRVSPGCENCYAESFAKRVGYGPTPKSQKKFPIWGVTAGRRFFGDDHWAEPLRWDARAGARGVRERVFCASMADVFEDVTPPASSTEAERVRRVELADRMASERQRLRRLIEATPNLDWLLLTKRPENIAVLAPLVWVRDGFPANVWLGTTAEDQKRADERIPHLMAMPAALRFVSYEPALEAIDFSRWLAPNNHAITAQTGTNRYEGNAPVFRRRRPLDWIIVGGESGGGARAFDLDWARNVIVATRRTETSVFVKQLGSAPVDALAVGSVRFRDRAAADWLEWPATLRVREVPIPFGRRDLVPQLEGRGIDRITLSPEVSPA